MSATRFRVRLSAVRALNLPAKDRNGTSDPYFRFSFDNFKTGKSEVVKRDCSPTWDFQVSFVYETQYLDRLKDKQFEIEVYDHDRFKRADFIGGAQVSLHDIAHGPTQHQLVLRDQHRNPAGKIYFTLEMDLWNDITVAFSDLVLTMNAAHVREPNLEIFFASDREAIIRTPAANTNGMAPPTWHDTPLLVFNTKFHTYKTGSFTFQVMSRSLGRVAIGNLPVSSLHSSKLNGFRIPVHPTGEGGPGSTIGHIEGTVHIKNAPTFGQLPSGVHTDKGVFHDIQDASGGNPVMSTLATLSGPPLPPKELPQMPISPLSSSVSSLVPSAPPMPLTDIYPPAYPPEQSGSHNRPLSNSGPRPISMNTTGSSEVYPGVYPPSIPHQYSGSGSPAPVAAAYGRRPSSGVYPPTNVSSHGTGNSVGSHGYPSPTVGASGAYPPAPPANYSPSSVYPPPFYATQNSATSPYPPPAPSSVYPPIPPVPSSSVYPPAGGAYPPSTSTSTSTSTSPGPLRPTSPYSPAGSASSYPPISPYPPMPTSPYPPANPYPTTGGASSSGVYPPQNPGVYPPAHPSVYPPPQSGVYPPPAASSVYPPPQQHQQYMYGQGTGSVAYPPPAGGGMAGAAGGVYPPPANSGYAGSGYYPPG
ncbi:hypothetical protein BCR44DRAFT_1427659 [Catenaria anguillulae PL171]|uniref:C2 domain-containing protein n=1 Tax=Catenaria anguillulae PL171 TaxID=765915 RepID=A0A1Y2HY90_9FUNG|nr:hypothetical protein BCR44DRAFT_1427659 [Catenaria anguillulae PL171]